VKPQFDLHGKVALVTGASRGIGRQAALTFAEAGADVIVNYRSHADEAEEVAQHIRQEGRRAMVAQCDVADRAGMEAMFAKAAETMGTVDIVVANAAYSVRQPLLGMDWDGFRRTLEVTQYGVFHTCQLAAQQMVRQFHSGRVGGKILIISSVREMVPFENSGAYNMAKAGINHFGRTLATEMARARINVNIINPGWIDTPGERKYHTDEQLREAGAKLPWGRMGEPEDIGKAAVFLCSDAADYITGTMLLVDGGLLLSAGLDNSCAENE